MGAVQVRNSQGAIRPELPCMGFKVWSKLISAMRDWSA